MTDAVAQLNQIMLGMNGNFSKLESNVKKNPDLYQAIIESWEHAIEPKNFSERCYVFTTAESPYCIHGAVKKFEYFSSGYKSCARNCACARQKHSQTMMANHGVENALQSSTIMSKFKKTLNDRYQSDTLHTAFSTQRTATNLKKYGVQFPLQSSMIRDQVEQTNISKYGTAVQFNREEIQADIQQYWQSVNAEGQRSYVRTVEDGKKFRSDYASVNFTDENSVLQDSELLRTELSKYSRNELSTRLGCSPSLIDSRVKEFNLEEFQDTPSYYEVLIENLLISSGIDYVRNTRKVIAPLELDFFVPSHGIAIEFCGIRWHGEAVGRDSDYHLNKYNRCKQLGIRLVQVFQDEWDSNSQVVRNIILRKLGILGQRLYTDTYTVQHISADSATAFLKQNHVSGLVTSASVYLGLIKDDHLAAVMSFTESSDHWKITQFAVQCGLDIPDVERKLFNMFTSEYSPTQVIAYCDHRYFEGTVYNRLGFVYTDTVEPVWKYSKGSKRFDQHHFTENQGYDKIWDSGYGEWTWESRNSGENYGS